MSRFDHRTKPATDVPSRIMSSRDHQQRLRKSIRQTLAWKYFVLLLLLAMATAFATFDIKAGTFSFTSAKSDLLSGVIASILVALIYDLFTKKQEEDIQEIDRSSLIDDMSREVFLARGAANLSKEDLLEITKVFLKDDRFLETLAEITSREKRYTENILHSYLIPMWRSPIAHFYGWENKLLPNPGDPRGYLWKSHQRFRIFSEMKIFRVAITDDAYIGTRILNSSAFNNLIVMANYNKETVNRNFVPTMQLKLESRVDGRRVFSPMTPRIVSFDKVFADKAIAEQYHSYEGIVTLVEYHIDVDTQDSVIEFDFSVPCSLDEPFFYAQAENLCFVDTLTIDYREISSKLAKVWATSFVGNATLELEHDFEEHIVTGKIDGVLMAGHGISLTWLNKAETP